VASAAANSPDPSMGEGGLQTVLDTAARAETKSLDPKAARIIPKAVAATWEVHRVWEILLSTAARVPGYCDKPVTQKKIESYMFHNRDSALNTKYIVVSPTCELSTCGVNRSPGVVGQGNDGGGGTPYGVYPCCKKSLSTWLNNICIKLKKLRT
jgi:hypothetical protein